MGRIQSTIGLASGIDIGGTIDKLMAVAAKPREVLTAANATLSNQETAVTALAGLLYSVKYISDNLGKADLYQQRTVTSSASGVLAATMTGTPALGTYEYTPLRAAQTQKLLSSGFASDSAPLGKGSVTIRFGDRVDRGASLSVINGGQGFVRGKMRIVDGNGDSAEIDLSTAQTVDDVLDAINGNTMINVTASARGGHFHLVDNTGGSLNLKVQDIGSGKTAASLGLAGINSSTGTADGQDIFSLYSGIATSVLNDGMGVESNPTLPDIKYTLRNGESGWIDLAPHDNTTSQGTPEGTLQQIIEQVEKQSGGKLRLSIAADGASLQLTDTTTGTGNFTLEATYGSHALRDLGLDATAVDGVVTAADDVVDGRRVLGGLKTVTLSSLNGGKGFGALGSIALTDRAGTTSTVDLAHARTLDDVVAAINGSAARIRAQVNRAGNGIELLDISAAQMGPMKVEDGDATATATRLNILSKPFTDANPNATAVNSGDMHLKVVGENTLLASLNGGAGVARGQFTIVDSRGAKGTVDLQASGIKTVGDAMRAINRLQLSVRAELNATGDGILLRDTGGGSGTLTVAEVGGGATARDLGLRRAGTTGENSEQLIDGSMTCKIDIWADDTLSNVKNQINQLNAGFSAAIVNDGSVLPFHLSLTSTRTGRAGAMVVDASGAAFVFGETAKAQDALLVLGPQSAAATATLASSSSNTFAGLVDGLKLDVKQASGQTVTVTVDPTSTNLTASVKTLVDNYNKFRDKLAELTKYDATQNKGAALTGDSTALRLDSDLGGLLSGKFLGAGKYQSLAAVGVTFAQDGKLQYDESKLTQAAASDPDAVRDFFATKETGVSARLGEMIEQLAGEDNSLISTRIAAFESKVSTNEKRIEQMNARLETQRLILELQFYNMELAISRFQTSLKSLDSLQWILNSYGNSSGNSK